MNDKDSTCSEGRGKVMDCHLRKKISRVQKITKTLVDICPSMKIVPPYSNTTIPTFSDNVLSDYL